MIEYFCTYFISNVLVHELKSMNNRNLLMNYFNFTASYYLINVWYNEILPNDLSRRYTDQLVAWFWKAFLAIQSGVELCIREGKNPREWTLKEGQKTLLLEIWSIQIIMPVFERKSFSSSIRIASRLKFSNSQKPAVWLLN